MKIAIPVWQNRVSPLFDTSAHLIVAETVESHIVKQELISVESLSLFQRIDLIKKMDVDVFICGGITRPLLDNIRNKNIEVMPFICGEVIEILKAVLAGKDIKEFFSMPGKSAKEKE